MAGAHLDGLVAELGRKLGLDGIGFDANGTCALKVDDAIVVHLARDEGQERALLYAQIGEPPTGDGTALLTRMLLANATEEGVLALHPQTGAPLLLRRLAVAHMPYSDFEAAIEGFLDDAGRWSRELHGPDEAAAAPADEMRAMSLGIRI